MERRRFFILYMLFGLILAANTGIWCHLSSLRPAWANVPPVPGEAGMMSFAMGDRQFAYRTAAFMLQNFGNGGGEEIALKDYDYKRLGQWLFLTNKLDPISDFVPMMAAYYFSATQNPSMLPPVIDYLEVAGKQPGEEKWRWLAQAVFLARFKVGDMNRALQLAYELAAEWKPGRPLFMKQMPALVMTAAGDKKTAYGLMLDIIKEESGKVQPAEINQTMQYICKRILDKEAAAESPLCHVGVPPAK